MSCSVSCQRRRRREKRETHGNLPSSLRVSAAAMLSASVRCCCWGVIVVEDGCFEESIGSATAAMPSTQAANHMHRGSDLQCPPQRGCSSGTYMRGVVPCCDAFFIPFLAAHRPRDPRDCDRWLPRATASPAAPPRYPACLVQLSQQRDAEGVRAAELWLLSAVFWADPAACTREGAPPEV
jgi:hypothetical protein